MTKASNLRSLLLLVLLTSVSASSLAQSWQNLTVNPPGPISGGNMRLLETDGTRIYMCGERGVYVSSDNGAR